MARVVVVSDTHLSERTPEAAANWAAVVGHVGAVAPDLVVHLGDLTLDAAHRPEELAGGRRALDQLATPWRAVPGNHDIGDNRWTGSAPDSDVSADRRRRWVQAVGDDWWSLDIGAWTLVGLDAQLLGSGLAAEEAQWAWLAETVAAVPVDRPVALVLHKPLRSPPHELGAAPVYRFVPSGPADRIEAALTTRRAPLVLSGHVHQYRVLEPGGRSHVWAPSTWAVLPDEVQPVLGAKHCGLLDVLLGDDGRWEATRVRPAGVAQLVLGRDIPDPYAP